MPRTVCLHPLENCVILIQPGDDFFKTRRRQFLEKPADGLSNPTVL